MINDNKLVFSNHRKILQPQFVLNENLKIDIKQKMDGIELLKKLDDKTITLVFFDPQYRSILAKQKYGNKKDRQVRRAELIQMPNETIKNFIFQINRVLIPSGHMMLWVDKYILLSGDLKEFIKDVDLNIVDMITWNKERMGMGYRTRRYGEYLVILQKSPKRAKNVWKSHNIPDVWNEKVCTKNHTHSKPIVLQTKLIESVTNEEDLVIDPAAGSYSIMQACFTCKRHFLGCDLNSID